jgi:hypothetical protein
LNIDIEIIGERSMTRTTNTFGGLAFAILTVLALWTSTLAVPQASAAPAAASVPATGPAIA